MSERSLACQIIFQTASAVWFFSLPASVRFATNGEFRESLQYRYDSMGNIIEVSENGRMVCRYELQTKKLHT